MIGLDEDIHFHTLRATFASWVAESGASAFTIKELLGHTDVKTTEQYTRMPERALVEAVNAIGVDSVV